ncbi:unnamed protein product [Heligmosomoides polygyrus]|uniref:Phospholipase B-like n=1 Tax=Heligmosomoides polygyrus TaxID=6339 RepID=A0A183GN86_HELPZ|nr:unnamed protein product [Heligmosomoides polygyrus]
MSFYLTALFCLLAVIEANDLEEFCFDKTKDARPWIIEYVQEVIPKLMWNEGLEEIAKEYGDHGKKPQNADNYIYLEKEKTFNTSTGIRKMANDVMASVSSRTKAAVSW